MAWYGMHDADGKGFSLIEVLAVLAIIALLVSLALPAYRGQVLRAKRVQGQAALLKTMQQQERYYSQHNRYLAFSAGAARAEGVEGADGGAQVAEFAWWSGEGGEEGAARSAYELDAAACLGSTIVQCVLLRARPGTERVDAQFRDAECGTLTLSSTGERGSAGPAALCWP